MRIYLLIVSRAAQARSTRPAGSAICEAAADLRERGIASQVAGVAFFGALAALIITARALDAMRRRTRVPIDLDELPPLATQRFELSR